MKVSFELILISQNHKWKMKILQNTTIIRAIVIKEILLSGPSLTATNNIPF